MARILFVIPVLCLGVLAPACSNARGTCEADCELRIERCAVTNLDCAATCDTYVDLGDPGGCAEERLVYQSCVVDSACTTDCGAELASLNTCVAANSPGTCFRHCRDRADTGCGDGTCDDLCLATEYLGRATDCQLEVDRWTACLVDGSQCDAGLRCLGFLNDANNCRAAYCTANPTAPACR